MKPKNQAPRKRRRTAPRNPPPQSRLNSVRQEKPFEQQVLTKRHIALIASGVFLGVYLLTGWAALPFGQGLSAQGVSGLDAARQELTSLLQHGVTPDSEKFQQFLAEPFPGIARLEFRPDAEGVEHVSGEFSVPVNEKGISGSLIALPESGLEHNWPIRLLLSMGASLMVIALWLQLQARKVTQQVDALCRQFVRYRREQEPGDMNLEGRNQPRTTLERRVDVLQELWGRFQSMQSELAHNVRELEESKQQLESTVEDLHQAQKQERRLVELGYAVAEFGHDIGNTNGSIMSFTSLLLQMLSKEEVSPMERVRALTYIRRVSQSSVNIKGLTEDILEFANGRVALKEEVFEFEDFEAQLDAYLGFVDSVPVDYCIPPQHINLRFKVDGRKLIRVIVNLVKNAWEKLREVEGGHIEIRFIPSHNDLIIQVVDNGDPIPSQILAKLFEPFQTQGKERGTGLGLAISRKMVELHEGNIEARNLPVNAGVVFQINLPGRVIPEVQPVAAPVAVHS